MKVQLSVQPLRTANLIMCKVPTEPMCFQNQQQENPVPLKYDVQSTTPDLTPAVGARRSYGICQHSAIELSGGSMKQCYFPSNSYYGKDSPTERAPANIKDLLVSWKVCNENLVELHQSDRSIRPVSHHYPISLRCVRIQSSQLRPSLRPSARAEPRNQNPDR